MNLPAPVAKNFYPLVTALALYSEKLLLNTMVTNVVTTHAPLYFAGAKLIRALATGPIIDQSGVFHTVFTFDGELSIGFTACREMLPDPQFYAECIQASFDELKLATIGKQGTAKKKRVRKKKRVAASKETAPAEAAG
jgi:hypothetical protein